MQHVASQCVDLPSTEWNREASLPHLLHVYRDFDPALLGLFLQMKSEPIRVWQLLDMEKLPTWVVGKMVCNLSPARPTQP